MREMGIMVEAERVGPESSFLEALTCRTLRRFVDGLAQLERALQEHIRIENRVIFPAARERERLACNAGGPGLAPA